jgi:hypothetical protein
MALTRRQRKLYEHTMDVYRKSRNGPGDWVYTLHLSEVPCYFYSSSNADSPMPVGLQKRDIAIMQDKLHFEASLDVKGQDMIKKTTAGHPDKDEWYSIQGEPMVRASTSRRSPNVAMVFINKTTKPPLEGVA